MPALEGIFTRYKKPVFNFALRFLANRAEAEDVASDVFFAVMSGKYHYTPKAKFSTWLFTVTRNACISRIRNSKKFFSLWFKSEEGDDQQMQLPDHNTLPAPDELIKKEQSVFIERALAHLPLGQREAIILKEFQDMSYEEIAKVLNCSLSNVKILIFRGRENLRREIKTSGLEELR
ncbi:MAG: RNA polymerase sigma factor [Candidatus Omnitrophica bacterium]|nr:RNA polymerase sigma factor [Candidatus Omnitrophota bacterium]